MLRLACSVVLLLRGVVGDANATTTETTSMTTMTTSSFSSTSFTSSSATSSTGTMTSVSSTSTSSAPWTGETAAPNAGMEASTTRSITSTSSITSSTATTMTSSSTSSRSETSSSLTHTSTTSLTATYQRPVESSARAATVPECKPEIQWALQSDQFSEITRHAGIGENLDCRDVNGELFIFLALQRCPESTVNDVVRSYPSSSPSLFAANGSGVTPLLAAASRGFQVTRTLIGLGANCSVIDHQGLSLLHHSAAWALLQPVAFQLPLSMVLHQLLLFDTWGDQPLHRALRHRRFSEALAVLRYVELADPVLAQRVVTSANAVTGEQLAHLNADLTLFEELRRLGAQSLSTVTSWGALPWHTVAGLPGSVSSGTLLQLAQLLQVPVETTDTRHRTALHYAAEGGDAVNVQWLISQGAALRARDAQRQMPLQLALAQGHWHIVSIFHAANGYALEAACGFGNVTLVRSMVLEQGYDPHLKDEKNGRSPIFEALEKGQIAVAEFLASQNVSLIALDALGVSVLGAAVQAQRWNSVEFLVQRIPVMQRMANDSTALHFAAQGSSQEIIGTLVRSGVLVDAVDYQNRTALFYSHGAEAVEALLAMGASSAHRDRGGRTALHLAAAEGRDAALEALLASRNSQVDGLDAEGRSALHLAVLGGHVGTTRTLLRWCASTLRDQSGQLPNDLAPAGVVRDLLLTGSEEQCQCDCGRFPFNPEWTTETWTNCSTVVRCRSGGSGVALSCERARSVPLTSPGTGQWSEVELYCRTVSGAETDRRSALWLLVMLATQHLGDF